jgi:hypothetical protein
MVASLDKKLQYSSLIDDTEIDREDEQRWSWRRSLVLLVLGGVSFWVIAAAVLFG